MKTFKHWLLELIFPHRCLSCRLILDDAELEKALGAPLCAACRSAIPYKNGFACAFCSAPVVLGKTCPFCKKQYWLDRLWVASDYNYPPVKTALAIMKYQFVPTLALSAAEIMCRYFKQSIDKEINLKSESALIVFIPLSRRRYNWRGFNQSELIAQNLAIKVGLPFAAEALQRVKHTKPQVEVNDRNSRIRNAQNIFICRQPKLVKNKTVLLVDDVATTGATLNDGARALKSAGAKEIIGFVFAKNISP